MRDGGSEAHARAALWAWRWRLIAHRAEPFESDESVKLTTNAAMQRMVATGRRMMAPDP
jgi:hypothetical protein